MRRRGGVNQRIALPLLQKLLGVGQHRGFALVVGRGKVDEGFAQNAAHAGRLGFFRDRIFEVVHVGEGGDAAANLFRRRQPRAPADKFFVHVLCFRRENVFVEPVVESDVIVQAAKQRHGHVGVAVDESGQDQLCLSRRWSARRNILASISARGPTATIVSPFTAMAPSSRMACEFHPWSRRCRR